MRAKIMPAERKVNIGDTFRVVISANPIYHPLLLELIRLMSRKSNTVNLNSSIKTKLSHKLRISKKGVDVCLPRFINNGYMLRLSLSTYVINPDIAIKCSNQEYHSLSQFYFNEKMKQLEEFRKSTVNRPKNVKPKKLKLIKTEAL